MEINPRDPNFLIHLANALRQLKESGMLGEMLTGSVPELIEKLAYGEKPYSGTGQTLQLDPGIADAALMAAGGGMGAGTAAKGASKEMAKSAAEKVAAHALKVRTERGVKPTQAQLSGALRQDEVLSRGMIPDPYREAYRRAAPRPYKREPAPVRQADSAFDKLSPTAQRKLIEARLRAN